MVYLSKEVTNKDKSLKTQLQLLTGDKQKADTKKNIYIYIFFFYLGFLSRTFTIHGTAGEGGGYLFNSSLPLPPASQTLRH